MGNLANLEQGALRKSRTYSLVCWKEIDSWLWLTGLRPVRTWRTRQAKRAGAMGIVGGLANIGIAAATGGFGGGGEGAINAGEKALGSAISGSGGGVGSLLGALGGGLQQDQGGRVKYGHGGKMNEDVLIAILQEGGMNAPVTKLEGEFDHSTNKKAIIDEETGVKEAVTGGEYILNPEQGED